MDNFKASADRAKERGDKKTAKRIMMERRIVFALVDKALKDGHSVSVFDCEEWTVKLSKNKKQIRNALFTTDMDNIRIRNDAGESLGTFSLIYGECGYDVISDYTVTDYSEELYNSLGPMIDKMMAAA